MGYLSTGTQATNPAAVHAAAAGVSYSQPLLDGDAGTAQTIDLMRAAALAARSDPTIRAIAGTIVAPQNPRDTISQARAIFDWVRDNVRFVRDAVGHETVQAPRWTIQYRFGDCDDMSLLLAALLGSVGIPARFVTVSLASPDSFDHVYAEAYAGGRWIPCDAARDNPQFGVTSTRALRSQVWEIDAQAETLAGAAGLARLGDDWDVYDPSTGTTYTYDAEGQVTSYIGAPETGSYIDYTTGALVTGAGGGGGFGGMTSQQIAALIAQGGNAAAGVIRAISTPGTPLYNPQSPYFNRSATGSTNLFGVAGLTTNMVLIGGLAFLALSRK